MTDHVRVCYSEQFLARFSVPHPHIIMAACGIELGRLTEKIVNDNQHCIATSTRTLLDSQWKNDISDLLVVARADQCAAKVLKVDLVHLTSSCAYKELVAMPPQRH